MISWEIFNAFWAFIVAACGVANTVGRIQDGWQSEELWPLVVGLALATLILRTGDGDAS